MHAGLAIGYMSKALWKEVMMDMPGYCGLVPRLKSVWTKGQQAVVSQAVVSPMDNPILAAQIMLFYPINQLIQSEKCQAAAANGVPIVTSSVCLKPIEHGRGGGLS